MKRRIFSFVLALVMTLGLLPAAAHAEGEGYGDVPEQYWAADAIKRWSESGVVSGSNGLFRPNDTM